MKQVFLIICALFIGINLHAKHKEPIKPKPKGAVQPALMSNQQNNIKIDRLKSEGLALMRVGSYKEAIIKFTEIIHLDEKNASAWEARGVCYYSLAEISKNNNDLIQALHDYNVAISINPQNGSHYFYRSLVYLYFNDINAAVNDLQIGVSLGNSESVQYLEKINVAINQQRQQQERQNFDQGVAYLAERFTSAGGGRIGSPAFQIALGQAGRGL